ncbi:MAG TPA: flagellar hook protein FlgE [Alphaproteobacteria bacterium]|nr:flagellar hook protein FlgE [Alphaproteobacteria bacterium]
MSLYGALLSGVSGLRAQSQSLGTISDNISNVNTIAYKRSVAQFSTLVTGASSTSTYFPGGVRASPRALVDQQGVLQTSTRATDVAILGNGFFVVKSADNASGEQLYTRSGSWAEDNQGRLVNSSGYFLQGWALDQQGNIIDVNTIDTVSVSTLNGVAVDTTNIEIGANLDSQQSSTVPGWNLATFMASPAGAGNQASEDLADGTVTPHFRRALKVFDALGTAHNLNISFVKLTGANQWGYSISAETPAEVTGAIGNGGLLGFGSLTFNGDGSLNAVDFRTAGSLGADLASQALPVTWANGAAASSITFDFGTEGALGVGRTDGVTQFASPHNIAFVNQDGAEVGLRTGVSIDADGFVIASFSNGATQKIWKLPVATFANPARLEARNGNAYAQTNASGEFNLREANTGGAGRIEPGALEGSNVDLSEEFTAMIVTQRAYSASAKTITTADEMLDELLRIKR